ncbi:MAG: type II secretion system protein [Planctomycetota bacterium]
MHGCLWGAGRRGFTLIELLVVIGIIALLIGIALPVLGTAREQAKQTQCLSNLRGAGQSLVAYATDNKDVLPPSNPDSGFSASNFYETAGTAYDFRPPMKDYVSGWVSWLCPSVDGVVPLDDPGNTRAAGSYGTYSYMAGRVHPAFGLAAGMPIRLNDHGFVSSTLVLIQDRYETDTFFSGNVSFNHGRGVKTEMPTADNPSYSAYSAEEGAGANLVYFDGHGGFEPANALEDVGAVNSNASLRSFSRLPE